MVFSKITYLCTNIKKPKAMKTTFNLFVAMLLLMLPMLSHAQNMNNVPFTINNSYFASVDNEVFQKKFNSEKEFLRHFHPAFVNADVKSQKIDFTKKFAIALVGEVTNIPTEYEIISVKVVNEELLVSYKETTKGDPGSCKIKPQTILVLDMKYARMNVNYERIVTETVTTTDTQQTK